MQTPTCKLQHANTYAISRNVRVSAGWIVTTMLAPGAGTGADTGGASAASPCTFHCSRSTCRGMWASTKYSQHSFRDMATDRRQRNVACAGHLREAARPVFHLPMGGKVILMRPCIFH
jgi:hypothetical protein